MAEQHPNLTNGHQSQERLIDRAAVYVRVSSTGQMGRDGDDDGYSIPAQVQACEREAQALSAEVTKAYVERAESARTDARPVLQQMLKELPSLGVRYLIVHKVDRLARNRTEDGLLYQRLVKMGITLVSASENIDETPAGRLMHGMLATFAEYYSNNLATEVMKGLTQKARSGGTPNRAPLGYLNRRKLVEGREIRTVEIDSERAPSVRLAFDLYASGEYSVVGLTDTLNALGLRTRPTPSRPAKELAPSVVYKILSNPYYIGRIVWNGAIYDGRHESLIDRDTFERVQAVLSAHGKSGDHRMKQHHYLKGSLVCAHCGKRMVYGLSRGRNGTRYPYFSCIGRVKKSGCPNRANIRAERLEDAVEHEYAAVERSLRQCDIERTKAVLQEQFARLRATADNAADQQRRRIAKLQDRRRELLELHYERAIGRDLFREEQDRLTREIETAEQIMSAISAEFTDTEETLLRALDASKGIAAVYGDAADDPELRRMMNQLFFERIEVEVDGTVEAQLSKPFSDFRSGRIVEHVKQAVVALRGALETANPGHLLDGRGSYSGLMVGAAGFEPATSRV